MAAAAVAAAGGGELSFLGIGKDSWRKHWTAAVGGSCGESAGLQVVTAADVCSEGGGGRGGGRVA